MALLRKEETSTPKTAICVDKEKLESKMVWFSTEKMIRATKVALENLYKPLPVSSLFPELDDYKKGHCVAHPKTLVECDEDENCGPFQKSSRRLSPMDHLAKQLDVADGHKRVQEGFKRRRLHFT
eukprot:CAMPEP_0170167358 /NCGR_PEP_ID=MMETSP0040_2-20121228/786_1 /TAXON_ID=641309 /ORGANISM="Lotharella oceanica, Strain CCMP622" /LENGTH=124 /DNA_ID=CAMNT_0010405357 /DNA_START=112 /DNA_END=486 /DNA_ORIENTATION=+